MRLLDVTIGVVVMLLLLLLLPCSRPAGGRQVAKWPSGSLISFHLIIVSSRESHLQPSFQRHTHVGRARRPMSTRHDAATATGPKAGALDGRRQREQQQC